MAGEPPFTVGEFFQLLGYISGALAFIVLIGLDMRNAFKKGAQWVPGHALILSALTIQVMNFIENQSTLLDESLENLSNREIVKGDILLNNLFMIHTTRVMLCVMVAFFMPAMARPGYEEKWTKIAALGLSVFLDLFAELSAVHKRFGESTGLYFIYSSIFNSWPRTKKIDEVSFFVSGAIITITLIWLILLLISAAIASKSIRHITTHKIPIIILADDAPGRSWKGVEDQVLKSWIVARACYPESIIARSVLASSAAVGVTICIICSIAGWISHGPIIGVLHGAESWLKFTTTILEVVFILLGWVVICWRSLSSVAYYGRRRKEDEKEESEAKKEERWFHYFEIEDFWTRHIVDLQEAENLKLRKLKVDERCSVVFFSKVYWLLSQLVFGNSYVRKIVSIIFSNHFKKADKDIQEYEEILKNMDNVLWDQTARDVFLSNRKSIKQAKIIMTKGNKDGLNCHALIQFLKEKRSRLTFNEGILCLDPGTPHREAGYKFLWKLHPDPALADVEKYFEYASKRSWKLTTVLLINVIVRLYAPFGTNCLEAYYEAWEFIDLVDESDPGTDSLLSKGADRLFTTLRNEDPEPTTTKTMEEADAAIKKLAENTKKDAEIIRGKIAKRKDTMEDWEKLAAQVALYKLCKSIDCTAGGDFMDLIHELQSALADIIGACMTHVGCTLVENSTKWARDLDKNKLLEAVYIAGKLKGLMEKLRWEPVLQKEKPKVQIGSTSGESGSSSNLVTGTSAGEKQSKLAIPQDPCVAFITP